MAAATEVPFVKPSDLLDYCSKQVTPLIEQVRSGGTDASVIKGVDKRAMNAFTGLILYVDSTYGSEAVLRMLETPEDTGLFTITTKVNVWAAALRATTKITQTT